MNQFYQNLITQKSWDLLQKLKKDYDFILIGGWAVYLYTRGLKSKDIDIIINYPLLEQLKQTFEFHKNERLKKYEINKEEIDIDCYLPYFSHLGLPVEKITSYIDTVETFTVLKKEVLLVTKQKAYIERKASVKGQKDKIDILSLVFLSDFDFEFYHHFITTHNLHEYVSMLKRIVSETKEVQELQLNAHYYAKKKREVLGHIR